ncbi:MAG: SCO6745 family protein [Acidimicrobiales bacterium]
MITDDEVSTRARAFGGAIEPVTAQVYFAPECHAAYEALGFNASPATIRGVAMPDGPAYFCSRGSVLGQVPGEVVAATFAVFNPAVVVPSVAFGWTLTDAATICAARADGAVAQLTRILGDAPEGAARAAELLERAGSDLRPEGRPLYAAMTSLPEPASLLGQVWRRGDRLREFRGDAHTAAWTAAGFDAVEIGLLTELLWGLPLRTYVRTRAWSDAELDEAEARLVDRGLLTDAAFTDEGRRQRDEIERATDRQCRPIIEALGDDLDELLDILLPWGAAVRDAGGYPAAGPHDLARVSSR